MRGFIYRLGQSLKDCGECAGHERKWYAGAMIKAGLCVREWALSMKRLAW